MKKLLILICAWSAFSAYATDGGRLDGSDIFKTNVPSLAGPVNRSAESPGLAQDNLISTSFSVHIEMLSLTSISFLFKRGTFCLYKERV